MKQLLFFLLALAFAMPAFAKGDEVIISRPYTRDQRYIITEETQELKLKHIALNLTGKQAALATALQSRLQKIMTEDYEHFIFSLVVSDNHGIQVHVESFDPFDEPIEFRDNYLGVIKIGHCYFFVRKGRDDNDPLHKALFTKDKGKSHFVRIFELVNSFTLLHDTTLSATFNEGTLQIADFKICGELVE